MFNDENEVRVNRKPFPKPGYLSDDEYRLVQQNTVRLCADVFLVSRDCCALYLAYRRIDHTGWWGFGGGVNPGEGLKTAAIRHFKDGTGITLSAADLDLCGTFRFMYGLDYPRDSFSMVYSVDISDSLATINLNNDEFFADRGLRKVAINDDIEADLTAHPGVGIIRGMLFSI